MTSFILGGDNKARDDASRPHDVGGTSMDLIDGIGNESSSNGLKIPIFLTKTQELNLPAEDKDDSCQL